MRASPPVAGTKTADAKIRATAVVVVGGVLPVSTSIFASDTTMASWSLATVIGIGLALFTAADHRLPRPIIVATVAAVAVFTVTAATSATPLLSLIGRYPRYEGLVTIIGYALALIAGARLLGPTRERDRDRFTSAVAVAALIQAAASLWQAIAHPDDRIIGLLGNSSVLASWALLTLVLLGWRVVSEHRTLWMAGLAASALVLALAASRAAWIGAAAALGLTLLVRLRTRPRPPWWPVPCGALILGLLVLLVPSGAARATSATPFAAATISGRLLLWQDSLPLIAASPILGVGPSRFVDAIGTFHSQTWAAIVGPYAPPDSPHNFLLQILIATGAIGLVAVTVLIIAIGVRLSKCAGWDVWQAATITATAGLAVTYLFSFTDPVTTTTALLLVGGAVAEPRPHLRSGRPAPTWSAYAGTGLWILIAISLAGSALLAEARYSAVLTAKSAAASDLVAVASVRPWDPDLAIRIGSSFATLAGTDSSVAAQAIPMVQSACRQVPESSECHLVLGDLQTLAGQPATAVTTLRAGLALDPTNVDLFLKLGIAQAEDGDSSASEASFKQAARLRPIAPEPWQNLAVLYQRLGRTADAQEAATQAKKLQVR